MEKENYIFGGEKNYVRQESYYSKWIYGKERNF